MGEEDQTCLMDEVWGGLSKVVEDVLARTAAEKKLSLQALERLEVLWLGFLEELVDTNGTEIIAWAQKHNQGRKKRKLEETGVQEGLALAVNASKPAEYVPRECWPKNMVEGMMSGKHFYGPDADFVFQKLPEIFGLDLNVLQKLEVATCSYDEDNQTRGALSNRAMSADTERLPRPPDLLPLSLQEWFERERNTYCSKEEVEQWYSSVVSFALEDFDSDSDEDEVIEKKDKEDEATTFDDKNPEFLERLEQMKTDGELEHITTPFLIPDSLGRARTMPICYGRVIQISSEEESWTIRLENVVIRLRNRDFFEPELILNVASI